METLSPSSLPKFSRFLDVSLIKTTKNRDLKFTNNSVFNIQPIKKIITQKSAVKISTAPVESLVQGRRKQSLHEIIFKPLHDFISRSNNSSHPPFLDPKHVLSGNLSPVDELPPASCEVVEGSLPPCLDGAYIQNGPNPQFFPRGPYHYVDGDGMLHSIKISKGKAIFCSRFVKTFKYIIERDLGYPVFPDVVAYFISNLTASMALSIARFLSCQFNPFVDGFGPANTGVALIGGRLLALAETDLPYEVKITSNGDIITLGRHDFHSSNHFLTMTAHPKSDPDTGETFAFRYFIIPPFLTYFRIDSNGRKHNDVPMFSMKGGSFVHDFAVTKNFAIFPDPQYVIRSLEILRGRPMMTFDTNKVSKLGVIPRYAEDESEMYWIDAPGLNMLHTVNSWEEDDGRTIVIVASNILSTEHALGEINSIQLEKITIDAKARKVVMRHPVSSRNLDFGAINTQYSGKKNRYVYAAVVEGMPKMVGLVKIDLSPSTADFGDCTVASRMYGPGCYGSEPIFVAREPRNPAAEEDDGYVVTYVNNENTIESHFLVMDAKSPTLEIVAAVKLPRMVPQGFHCTFVKESDLKKL